MSPLDALIHLVNLFLPALALGAIGATLSKLCWRRELAGVRWWRLALWPAAVCALVILLGLVIYGHDGAMLTYAAMVLASALAIWWAGFGSAAR